MARPKLTQQVFEARYERGYRYLDRCGDAMLILEEVLPQVTGNKIWMTDEMIPSGAKLKCPELDLSVSFNTYQMIVDQGPIELEANLGEVGEAVYAVISARFDLREPLRFGCRRWYQSATDSHEEAEQLSLRLGPVGDWLAHSTGMRPRSTEAVTHLENESASEGMRVSIEPIARIEAPLKVDARLNLPPHMLHTGQREALISQQQRRAQREKSPVAGVLIDIDVYAVRPPKLAITEFVRRSAERADTLATEVSRS